MLGLAPRGLHSNGYSLARKVVFERLGLRVRDRSPGSTGRSADELLRPTRIYVKPVLALLRAGVPIRAMAHITGGGITGNLPRVLPAGCRAVIRRGTWPVPQVFRWLQRRGRIDEAEMFRTFNMGIGFVLVVPAARAASVLARLWKERAGLPDRRDPPGDARGDVPIGRVPALPERRRGKVPSVPPSGRRGLR